MQTIKKVLVLSVTVLILIVAVALLFFRDQDTEKLYRCPGCNVILITTDSLRSDHLGYMGYERDTSPYLDTIAKEGVVFTKHYAQSSFTPPSLASIMTSQYVAEHGLIEWNELSDDKLTISEILKDNGYQTIAFNAGPHLNWVNLDQGFKFNYVGSKHRAGRLMNKRVLDWLEKDRRGKYFMWIHYFDAHRPYKPRTPYRDMYTGGYEKVKDPQREFKNPITLFKKVWSGKRRLTDAEEEYLISLYDGGISFQDTQIGSLISKMKTMGALENTIIIITADHGENLNEHKTQPNYFFSHDPTLYDQVTRVPLIFWADDLPKGIKTDTYTQSIDIAPTILEMLEIKNNNLPFRGKSLIPLFFGRTMPERDVFSQCEGWENKRMVISDGYKYILDLNNNQEELFHLSEDPGEKRNLIDTSDRSQELREKINIYIKTYEFNSTKEYELREKMKDQKSLGYI
jgi:choline-sulfatase